MSFYHSSKGRPGRWSTGRAYRRKLRRKARLRLIQWIILSMIATALYLYFWGYAWWVPWTLVAVIPLGVLSLFGIFYVRRKQLEVVDGIEQLERRYMDPFGEEE